jgi:glycolate oxidase
MKNVAGIDLCKLLIGSWGTLGIITDAVMRIFPIPEVSQSVLLTFAGIEDAFNFVSQLLVSKLTPSSVELLDRMTAGKLESSGAPPLEENGVLLMTRISGSREDVERHRKEINLIAGANKVLRTATLEGDEATRLWQAYSGLHGTIMGSQATIVKGKASVPLSRQGEMFRAIKEVGVKSGVAIGITVHGYNGILYSYIDTGDADPVGIINDLSRAATGLGGFFIVEFAPLEVRKNGLVLPPRNDYRFMQSVKTAFDPGNILNPGKLVGRSG